MICKKCIMDHSIPNIQFSNNGICSYCHLHDRMEEEYHVSEKTILDIVSLIKERGKNKKYDCIIGISGGCDSSFLLYKLKDYGLRPLAITFDNNWGSEISVNNIRYMLDKLDIDIYTYTVDKEECNDILKSFLYASVPDADIPNDIAITKLYYMAMNKYDLEYSICGHSFRTEGTAPVGWTYMDGKYVESVHRIFGKIPMKTFLNLEMDYWLKNINKKRIRLLYYMDYKKEEAKEFLSKNFGWQWYGSHHFENEYTKFVKSYLLPNKFNIDKRIVEFSALVRSGQMDREKALDTVASPPFVDSNFVEDVMKKLNISQDEFQRILKLPIKSYKDYETYKDYFLANKDKFAKLMNMGCIPRTFYEKYCT